MVNKITAEDLINKGVIGLPDVPGLTTIEMQKKLDEISIDVIIPRFNELIDNTVSASDEFSKLSTYNVGDYCIYQSVLYKCTTAITTAGEWDSTKWKATAIDKELKEISSTPENKDAISDKYDSSKTYAVGDYCIYNDTLYKCKTAVTSAEEFDSSKWEATNCGKEFEVLNSNLNVRYNPDTDMVQIYYNGAWKDWEIAGLQKYIMVENGAPKVTFENPNSGTTGTTQQIDGEWVVTSNNGGFRQLAVVDLTNRTTVTANMRATIGSGGSVDLVVCTLDNPLSSVINAQIANAVSPSKYNLDVSTLSGEYYVGVNVYGESGANTAAEITSLIVS